MLGELTAEPMFSAVSSQNKLTIVVKNVNSSNTEFNAQIDTFDCNCPPSLIILNEKSTCTTFDSPGYSTNSGYCNNLNCTSIISAPLGYQVNVIVLFINFRNGSSDSLILINGNGTNGYVLGKIVYNSDLTNNYFISAANVMTITFKTDNITSDSYLNDGKWRYHATATLEKLPVPTNYSLSSDQPFLLINSKNLSLPNYYWTVTAETGKQVHLYLSGDTEDLLGATILVVDGIDVDGKVIAQVTQLSTSSNGPLHTTSSSGESLTILLDSATDFQLSDTNLIFTQLKNDPPECGTSELAFLTSVRSPAVNVNISNHGNGTTSCSTVLIIDPQNLRYPAMQMNVSSLQGGMVLYGGLDYRPSSNNQIIAFSSMNDVISPLQVAGVAFLILLNPGSAVNLNFEACNYSLFSESDIKGGLGAKGLMMSKNFPNPNTETNSDIYSFSGIGNYSYEYFINVLHYDLGTTGSLAIKSSPSDSILSRTLNNNGGNISMHFCAPGFEVNYKLNGGGAKGFVLRYDVGSNWTCSPTTTKPSTVFIIGISMAGGLLLVIALIAIFCFLWYRRQKKIITHLAQEHNSVGRSNHIELAEMHTNNGDMANRNQYIDQPGTINNETCTRDAWEVASGQLIINDHEKLGSGAFCVVFKGRLEGKAPVCKIQPGVVTQCFENCEVAVKKLPEYADSSAKEDFVQEIDFMKRIGYHPHLISILGCIIGPHLDSCLIIEYCCNGDLLKYIRKRRLEIVEPVVDEETALRFKDLLSFAWQISDAMDFLSSKGYIHRDVAARNVLVNERKVAKIGDFGLCRLMDSTTYTTRGGRLPIKWMALESLQDYEYTTKSDVWSFGVLLYELFSLGAAPYSWLQPVDMIAYLRSGKRLDKPEHCADNVYSIMQECWKDKPDERPFFSDLKMEFSTLLSCATEEYGYLDIRQPSDGQYYRQVSNGSTSTEQSERDLAESTLPNNADLKSLQDTTTGTSCESDIEVFV
uniref:Protein kinase domain-containing protein n=1 Tax=Plectus sambesii TaxID=2011161 RepID=A0A914UJ95_9BILA